MSVIESVVEYTKHSFQFEGDHVGIALNRYDGIVAFVDGETNKHVIVFTNEEALLTAVRNYLYETRYIASDDARKWAERMEDIIRTTTESIRLLRESCPEAFEAEDEAQAIAA